MFKTLTILIAFLALISSGYWCQVEPIMLKKPKYFKAEIKLSWNEREKKRKKESVSTHIGNKRFTAKKSNVLDICRCQIIETCGHKNHFFFSGSSVIFCATVDDFVFFFLGCCCYSFTCRSYLSLLFAYFPCSFLSSPPTKSFAPQYDFFPIAKHAIRWADITKCVYVFSIFCVYCVCACVCITRRFSFWVAIVIVI